ncbi:MAG: hypothetical protein Q8P20_07875 [bacterium]|nr:hypothetical protein [bacterium]
MVSPNNYFKNFFRETEEINEFNYTTVDNGQIWDFSYTKKDILKIILQFDKTTKKKIMKKFIQIDYMNGDINHFVEYIMLGYAKRQIQKGKK